MSGVFMIVYHSLCPRSVLRKVLHKLLTVAYPVMNASVYDQKQGIAILSSASTNGRSKLTKLLFAGQGLSFLKGIFPK